MDLRNGYIMEYLEGKSRYQGTKEEFSQAFKDFAPCCDRRTAWGMAMEMMTAMLTVPFERDMEKRKAAAAEFDEIVEKTGGMDAVCRMFVILSLALEKDREQDFLGTVFMKEGFKDRGKGQFFTPYNVAGMMGKMAGPEDADLGKKGYVTVQDPCVGAGSMLIAAAAAAKENGLGPDQILVTGCDIDRTVAQMAFIQISLLGLAGWICVTDSLTRPVTGGPLCPVADGEIYYTPVYQTQEIWLARRTCALISEGAEMAGGIAS